MYVGRDFTELGMISKTEWKKSELEYFHHSLQQMSEYLNAEGLTIYEEIITEMKRRGGFKRDEADWTHGTEVTYD
ncbi:MAG: hypothetical protein K0S51_1986 [Bacillales bacterium]|jgi:regulator of sigma D|nr:hypothetical protein [Bacillales bacterium]